MHDNALQLLFEKDGETLLFVRYSERTPNNEKPAVPGYVGFGKQALREAFGRVPAILKLTVERA